MGQLELRELGADPDEIVAVTSIVTHCVEQVDVRELFVDQGGQEGLVYLLVLIRT